MIRAVLIAVVLWAVGGWAFRVLARRDREVGRPRRKACVNCADPACEGCWGADTYTVDDWRP